MKIYYYIYFYSLFCHISISGPIKIIDVFIYNDDPIAVLHLSYLYDLVDEFLIVQAKDSFTKVSLVEKEEDMPFALRPFAPKISFFALDLPQAKNNTSLEYINRVRKLYLKAPPMTILSHEYEEEVRDFVVEYIFRKYPEEKNEKIVIYFGNENEIPNKDLFKRVKTGFNYDNLTAPIRVPMLIFYYNFNWLWEYELWDRPMIINIAGLRDKKSFSMMRKDETYLQKITSSYGWQLNYFWDTASIKDVWLKYSDINEKNVTVSTQFIQSCIVNGLNFMDLSGQFLNLNDYPDGPPVSLPVGWDGIQSYLLNAQKQFFSISSTFN